MQATLTVLIDAGILAPPCPNDKPSRFHKYIDTLRHLRELLIQPWISVRLRENSWDVFVDEAGKFISPTDTIRSAIKIHGIQTFDEQTIAWATKKIPSLLFSSPHFEEYFNACVRDYDFRSNPDLLGLTEASVHDQSFERCVVLASILHCYCNTSGIRLFVKNTPDSGKIEIQASIRSIEPKRDDMGNVPFQPDTFKGDILICDSLSGLLKSIDWIDIAKFWKSDPNTNFETALQFSIFKFKYPFDQSVKVDWPIDVPVLWDSKFIESAKKCCEKSEKSWKKVMPSMFRTIADIVVGLNAKEHKTRNKHALKKNKKGGSQRTRLSGDKAQRDKAQRANVYSGYRLHYWQKSDGYISLDSIGPHSHESIRR